MFCRLRSKYTPPIAASHYDPQANSQVGFYMMGMVRLTPQITFDWINVCARCQFQHESSKLFWKMYFSFHTVFKILLSCTTNC